ncbi:MAG: efflux RND transporter periplasmic adaptor subunit [Usitatibacteraceae bacterium]
MSPVHPKPTHGPVAYFARPQTPTKASSALFGAVALATLAACGQGSGQAEHGGFPPPAVTYEVVTARQVAVDTEYVGQTAGSREIEIRSRINGIVEKRLFEEGSVVKAGQPLFKLESALYSATAAQAQAAVGTADANLKQAEREFNRLKPLIEARAISQKEWDTAASALDVARAQHRQAEAQYASAKVDLGYTTVTAPIKGVIGRALKVEGALASAAGDSLLATMAQTDPMHVYFSVAERDRNELEAEMTAGTLKLPKTGYVVRLKAADGQWLKPIGKMNFRDYKADANTGAYAARAEIPNPDNTLTPGQFVRVVLTGATRANAITLPQRAVLDGPMGKYVYVVGKGKDDKPAAEMRPVVPGEWVMLESKDPGAQNGWVIRSGLRAGDKVIVDGTAKIFAPGQPIVPMTPEEAAKAAAAQAPPAGAAAPAAKQ